ncbi:uncharacterized protein TNCV_1571041 [Trichonephila clavipes]|uniref:Uncharacterized protein n=1 Tax=Trichonephila clavipes TaxID=2585209 RepID=A0A8X6VNR8_TRICX|nr:uncharacterized protein TNCV_1571041 [Trichonephila clavipes]
MESAITFPSMSTWVGIHWSLHDLSNAPMENRKELISWVSPIFPSLMASRADLQSESTMMPSALAIFVRVRQISRAVIIAISSLVKLEAVCPTETFPCGDQSRIVPT